MFILKRNISAAQTNDSLYEPGGCIGVLFQRKEGAKDEFVCFTLEREYEGEERNEGLRIPTGTYNMELYASPKFGKVLLISNNIVSKERRILIHAGNTLNDTKGCILPGVTCDFETKIVYKSKQALADVLSRWMRDTNRILIIENDFKYRDLTAV